MMSGIAKSFISLAIVLASFQGLNAQQTPDTDVRTLVVSVSSRDGKALEDLTKDSFRIQINGKPAKVISADYSSAPRRIVVLLNMSASKGGPDKAKQWQIARDTLQDVFERTPSEVPLALITFSNKVHDVIDFPQARSSVAELLNQSNQSSKVKTLTAMRDAILAAVQMLQPVRLGDSIYLITDEGDNASHASFVETKRSLSKSGVRLLAPYDVSRFPASIEEKNGYGEVLQLSSSSGGFSFGVLSSASAPGQEADKVSKARSSSRVLSDFVNPLYALQVESPEFRKDAQVKLEIVDQAGIARKDAVPLYPRFVTK